jgi:hypothetical protein
MRMWKPTIQSIYGLLSGSPRATRDAEDAAGEIQEAMLDALGPRGAKEFPSVSRRIQYAADLQALWYLRGDLMAAVASLHGEQHARDIVREISAEFEGLLPGGLSTRPSPLND